MSDIEGVKQKMDDIMEACDELKQNAQDIKDRLCDTGSGNDPREFSEDNYDAIDEKKDAINVLKWLAYGQHGNI